jgi:hypothetical protein
MKTVIISGYTALFFLEQRTDFSLLFYNQGCNLVLDMQGYLLDRKQKQRNAYMTTAHRLTEGFVQKY